MLDPAVPRAGLLLRGGGEQAKLAAVGFLRGRPGDLDELIGGGSFLLELLLESLTAAAEAGHVLAGAGQVTGDVLKRLTEPGVCVRQLFQLRTGCNHRL
jgi:hypothetical protein